MNMEDLAAALSNFETSLILPTVKGLGDELDLNGFEISQELCSYTRKLGANCFTSNDQKEIENVIKTQEQNGIILTAGTGKPAKFIASLLD